MSKTIYLRNLEEKDSEWWKNILIDSVNWKKLIEEKLIIKKGSYYPRLKDSKKRGLNAFLEVARTYFKKSDKEFLLGLCKLKVCPIVSIDTLQLNVDNPDKHGLIDYMKPFKLESSDIPFDAVICDLNVMGSDKKIQTIHEMVDNLEFTPLELSKLINLFSSQLVSVYQ